MTAGGLRIMFKAVVIMALCLLLGSDSTVLYPIQKEGQGTGFSAKTILLSEAEATTGAGIASGAENIESKAPEAENALSTDPTANQPVGVSGAESTGTSPVMVDEKEEKVTKPQLKPEDIKITDYLLELKKLGYYTEEAKDAQLAKRNAVILFQSDHNVPVDGIMGKKSLEVLKKRMAAQSLQYPDKVKKPPVEGQWMTINKTRRILTLYEGTQVLKKYPVAVGNPSSLTPEGQFKIVVKAVNPTWGGGGYAKPVKGGAPNNPLGKRWMGISLKGGYSYGIHGNNQPYSIGKNASHGCIRMINFCVEELYDWVDKGTDVWIGTEKKLLEWGVVQDSY